MGRPSLKTPEIVAAICERLASGETLSSICKDDGMPAFSTVYNWEQNDPEFLELSRRAREIGTEALADECISIADSPCEGEETKYGADGAVVERKVGDMLGHRRLQIDTRLRLIGKWNAKRYGDKQQLEHSGKLGLEQLVAESRKRDTE